MVCSVYANLNDKVLTKKQLVEIAVAIIHLVEKLDVHLFILDDSRNYERYCKNFIRDFGEFFPHEVKVIKPDDITTYDHFSDLNFLRYNPFGDYMLCDSETKDKAMPFMRVERVIEFADSACIIVGTAF